MHLKKKNKSKGEIGNRTFENYFMEYLGISIYFCIIVLWEVAIKQKSRQGKERRF